MPDGGAPARAAQQSALSSLTHEFLTDEETGDLLDAVADADLTDPDAKGCLQGIHWTGGFASFQSYTVGSVLAAQLDDALREDIDDVDQLIRNGEFERLHDWMTEHVHRHGQRYPADELIERATGEPLTAEYFVEYAEAKFGDPYGV